jgi:autotransporter-associated beta strand protein
MTVPKGAEVLLETRLPYLTAAQRREVLRTTAFPAGNPLFDGPEQWGRLNLFAAADGYGAFDADVRVELDAARGGFHANDSWRNDIGGDGGLVKAGSGTLALHGDNGYRGGTRVTAGTLDAASPCALGTGPVEVTGGVLRVSGVRVGGYRQAGGTLSVRPGAGPALAVSGTVALDPGSTLEIRLDDPCPGREIPVLSARRVQGRFAAVKVDRPGFRVVPRYTPTGLSLRILREFS